MRLRMMVMFLLLCSSALFAQKPAPSTSDDLLKADRDFQAAVLARGADGWMEFMTSESVISRDRPYVGLDDIRGIVSQDYSDKTYRLTWKPDAAGLQESGTMGYTTGHFVVTMSDATGKVMKFGGQYLTVWKKYKDGSWKVLWDGGSSTGIVK